MKTKEKSFIQSLNKMIKEAEKLRNAGDDFCGTYIDSKAFDKLYELLWDVREVIKEDNKNK